MKHYAQRDLKALGQHYANHVSAMTGEGLELKSDVAAELAHRDVEIERRDARITELETQVDMLLAAAEDNPEAARIRELEDANNALRAQLAAAQSLRLGRAPTGDDIRRHVGVMGQQSQMLAGRDEESPTYWEVFILDVEADGAIVIDGLYELDECSLTDAIFLDSTGQPCPCGGWGGSR